ncbi:MULTISPECIES: hypothetical protein [Mycobacterium ulcerans group]|uniref:Uncharacterized protein n=2 Tax=Mycobacterium ulcerans group TaxID=2993898 RepID=A0A9N7LT10_9MYCO|nr:MULTISPECIES: hypothetical protein [Mycobacterium ulcerans group]ACA50946.1 conserved hypothetical protein [Mycobacterium marinum DL240490]MBC9862670.1 hypothetical protein [Mycobacterium pseudoshottsii]UZK92680.1 hypothetical protein OIO89_00840 [Mycobacterium ulcerans]BDN85425.1 hypothetical protein NJB1907Z4_P0770 [Mycobacterium pseudoshottsii]
MERERRNVDDAASLLVELGRVAAVDEWERNRIAEIRAEGERRRHGHRQAAATAVVRMQDRGETLSAIAELAGVKISEIRAVLRAAGATPTTRRRAQPSAVGAPAVEAEQDHNGAAAAPRALGASATDTVQRSHAG